MTSDEHRSFLSNVRMTSLATLLSRALGMLRDAATAALLGMSGSPAMDALVIAFRVPNLARRLFGEGALTASYLPVFSEQFERDRRAAWRLASVVVVWMGIALGSLVLAGQLLCAAIYWIGEPDEQTARMLGLCALLLPYALAVCLAAQLAATLNALAHFTAPALAPAALNVCWLAAALFLAPRWEDKWDRAYIIALAVLAAGVVQLAMQIPPLRRRGFRFDYNPSAVGDSLRRVLGAMGPMMFGLAVTQINTLADSLIAWGLAARPGEGETIDWLRGVPYPLDQGAASAVYLGERLYQFPVGVLGVAVATIIFPLLSRHAARGEQALIGADLTTGLRLTWFLAVPSTVGLVLLAEPIARLLFERGAFTGDDARRTARMIACYGWGVWAYCGLPVVVRGFYAVDRHATPVRIGMAAVAVNLTLNLTLVWSLGEAGLAVSTAIAASLQVVVLTVLFSRTGAPIAWNRLFGSLARTGAAAALMAAAVYLALGQFNAESSAGRIERAVAPMVVGGGVYLLAAWAFGCDELKLLFARRPAADR